MIARILKLLLGLAFIPFGVSASIVIFEQAQSASTLSSHLGRHFLLGVGVYCAVHLLFFKPVFLYVFGHELAHVFACWLCLGTVTSFRVSSKGGGVATSRNNFFIALAPYYLPTYAVIIALLYFLVSLWVDLCPYNRYFVFSLGAALAFHFVLTAEFIKTRQPDFLKTGYLFSLASIYIVNILILAGILSGLFAEISFVEFGKASLFATRDFYLTLYQGLFL